MEKLRTLAGKSAQCSHRLFHSCRRFPAVAGRALLAAAVLGALSSAAADTLILKDGRKIEGTIDPRQSDDTRVFIRTTSGIVPVSRSRIEKIQVRENVSGEEGEGDLALQGGNPDKALELYQRAAKKDSANPELARKITEVSNLIQDREKARFAGDFARLDEALKTRQFDLVIQQAEKLAQSAPSEAGKTLFQERVGQAYVGKAREFRNTVSYPQAEDAYRSAVKSFPSGPVAHLELAAMIGLYPAREKEAFELYRKGIDLATEHSGKISPDDLLGYQYALAELYLKASDERQAASLYWRVVQGDEKRRFAKAPDRLIEAYSAIVTELIPVSDENSAVVEILEKVCQQRSADGRPCQLLGRIYFERGNMEKAIPMYEDAVKRMESPPDPKLPDVRFALAVAYRKDGQRDRAEEQLKQVLKAQPTRYDAICDLGEIHLERARYPEALEQFERAKTLEASSFRAYLGAARVHRETKKYAEAIQQFDKLVLLRDDNPDYHFEKGLTLSAMGRFNDARTEYSKTQEMIEKARQEKKPAKATASLEAIYTQLGLTDVAEAKFFQALEHFDKALAIRSDYAAAIDGKGKVYRELGDLEKAEKFYIQAVEADPKNPIYQLSLGILYHQYKKNTTGALAYYQRYFERGGTDPQVKEWIRECGGTLPGSS